MSSPTKPNLLIASPAADWRDAVSATLQPTFAVMFATNLAETVEAIIQQEPALLLIDIEQPDGDCLAMIRFLRSGGMAQEMVISCVAHAASNEMKVQAFQAGADDFLVLPLDLQLLRAHLILMLRAKSIS